MASTRYRHGFALFAIPLAILIVILALSNVHASGDNPGSERDAGSPRGSTARVMDRTTICSEEYELPYTVEVAAREVVEQYRDEGQSVVVRAGYLDAYGEVWGCMLQGPGWVDLCVVSGKGEKEAGSTVRTVRMDSKDWGEAYGG